MPAQGVLKCLSRHSCRGPWRAQHHAAEAQPYQAGLAAVCKERPWLYLRCLTRRLGCWQEWTLQRATGGANNFYITSFNGRDYGRTYVTAAGACSSSNAGVGFSGPVITPDNLQVSCLCSCSHCALMQLLWAGVRPVSHAGSSRLAVAWQCNASNL